MAATELAVGVQEDTGEANMQCADHPYRNPAPGGGICAFCLQEKLGKLVSSSFPLSLFPSSSSSPSPSFRSHHFEAPSSSTTTLSVKPNNVVPTSSSSSSSSSNTTHDFDHHYSRNAQNKKNKKKDHASVVFKRSKSTTTPRRGVHFLDGAELSPRKRGSFWPFLYLSKHSGAASRLDAKHSKDGCFSSSSKKPAEFPAGAPALESKVSRSRSVGCGSRSFSGDFFERISTGFGDCTLRRVESQREGKPRIASAAAAVHGGAGGQDCIRERVKCGGIFSGLMATTSSSSAEDNDSNLNGKPPQPPPSAVGPLAHGRSRSWGWTFASPIRAFSKPSSGKRETPNKTNTTTNLNAIPSLLAARG
ncbi:uncharacterized protein LOC127811435 [Diospyros lotus]|uniref:uncharacterized protein LOC127811435 n=1 Tax=Diospyros lotus TaxID=55363 RepID=UPI00225AA6CB|nr:uncharacterized protein LOC127811435 [Diospyros lotus]